MTERSIVGADGLAAVQPLLAPVHPQPEFRLRMYKWATRIVTSDGQYLKGSAHIVSDHRITVRTPQALTLQTVCRVEIGLPMHPDSGIFHLVSLRCVVASAVFASDGIHLEMRVVDGPPQDIAVLRHHLPRSQRASLPPRAAPPRHDPVEP